MLVGILLALVSLASAAFVHHFMLLSLNLEANGKRVPAVRGWIPYVGCALDFVSNPSKFFEDCRKKHGDTFVIYVFGVRMLCTFSPEGVSSLYKLREREASFTQATKGLLSLKVPPELLEENDLRKFHRGLKARMLPFYVRYALNALDEGLEQLPQTSEQTLFPFIKSMVHRVGMACWVGPIALKPKYFQKMVDAYEMLDPESGFSNLATLLQTQVTSKRKEKRAFNQMVDLVAAMKMELDSSGPKLVELSDDPEDDGIRDNLSSMYDLHSEESPAQQHRLVAADVFHFTLASQANMYAGISWCLVHLMTKDPKHLDKVREEIVRVSNKYGGGDDYLTNLDALNELVYLECVIYETLRVVQQSITLRKVLQDSRLDTERGSIALPPSWYVATILSVTNMDRRHLGSVENLEEFVPERFMAPDGSVDLQLPSDLPPNASVLTSTFGHGAHACPGRRFALAVTKLVLARILVTFDLTPQFQRAEIPASSVGALARVVGDCRVTFERHAS